MGEALKKLTEKDPILWRRSDLVISTKIFWGGNGQNELGLSRKHIKEGVDKSLKRLQLDYVDIVYCHRYDPLTPMEEIVQAFNDVIKQGKALYWGTSMWTGQQITEAYWTAKELKLQPPVVEQPEYNLFERNLIEHDFLRLYEPPYGLAITSYSPLDCGILAGKYNQAIPKNSRFALKGFEWLVEEKYKKYKFEIVDKLIEYAKNEFNTSSAILSIAWCLKNKHVNCVLLGASNLNQINDNLKAIEIAQQLTKKHLDDIDHIVQNKPAKQPNFGRFIINMVDTNN